MGKCVYCTQSIWDQGPYMKFTDGQVAHIGCCLHPGVVLNA